MLHDQCHEPVAVHLEDLRRGGAMTPVEGLVAARRALTLTSVVAIL